MIGLPAAGCVEERHVKPASIAAQGLGWVDDQTRALAPPIHTSTTFIRDQDNQYRSGRMYARDQNPTFDQAEAVLTALEGGHASLLFASGMAAATALFQALSPGDHVLAPRVMYWSLRNWLTHFATQWGLRVQFVDMSDPDEVRNAVQSGKTKLIWVETPANPLWTITDIVLTCEIAHAAGAMVAVDSTVATPVLTRPFELGADIVMHSATKYLNGHSDMVGGVVIVGPGEERKALADQLGFLQNAVGAIAGPFDSFLALRGLKTLALRMERHCANALDLAGWLEKHPKVKSVRYPGLPSHPQHDLAKRQMKGFGGMITIYLDSDLDGARRFLENTHLFSLAESLGGVESLIEHPAIMTHGSIPLEQRKALGIDDSLVRLSVGVEDLEDLRSDLADALDKV
jgi:cystathionine gamma-synthase